MTCDPSQIKDIIAFLTPYGLTGVVVFFLIYYRDLVTEIAKTGLSWLSKK